MTNDTEMCRGCIDKDAECTLYLREDKSILCPCSQCLVASMCLVSCEEFKKFCLSEDCIRVRD